MLSVCFGRQQRRTRSQPESLKGAYTPPHFVVRAPNRYQIMAVELLIVIYAFWFVVYIDDPITFQSALKKAKNEHTKIITLIGYSNYTLIEFESGNEAIINIMR